MLREGITLLNAFVRIDAALSEASTRLAEVSESPRLDAELLLARALDVSRSFLFAHPDDEMDEAACARFQDTLDKRVDGMPLAYISGEKEFWSMELVVTPATLVPRPETEILVDHALRLIPRTAAIRVLDLGTGTGAIALAIARERPLCEIVATDISESALAVARENARRLQLPNIEFYAGSWIEPVVTQHFDLVVSNPPYIRDADPHFEDLRYEPRLALAAGPDGLDAIRAISASAMKVLGESCPMLIEHGAEQREEVAEILRADAWENISCANDLTGLPRITIAHRQN